MSLFFLILGAIVSLAVGLWAFEGTVEEIFADEPEPGAQIFPIIAGIAFISYYAIGTQFIS